MCFSDFIADPEQRSSCGKGFIGVVCFYAAVHMYFLLRDVILKVFKKLRRIFHKCINRKKKKENAYLNDKSDHDQKADKPMQIEAKLITNNTTEKK